MGWFRRNEHDEEQLSAYLDGELSSRHAENVEKHLSTCDSCAALLEELRGTRALLSALPTRTPRRSFVLGAEYAQAPVRDVATPPRRFSLALAPAVALSVFVALLFVDLADFSSTSSDESADTFTAARQSATDEDTSTTGAAGSIGAPSAPEAANATAEDGTDAMTTKAADETQPSAGAAAGEPEDGVGGSVDTPEATPAALGAEALPTPDSADASIAAAGEAAEEPSPAPLAFEAPEDKAGGGVSTLRILQFVAAAAFLVSGLYVFVWPRFSRGGS